MTDTQTSTTAIPAFHPERALLALREMAAQARAAGVPVPPDVVALGRWLRDIVAKQQRQGEVMLSSAQRAHLFTNGVCPACGQNTLDHRHTLTRPIAEGLLRLYHAGGGPAKISSLMSSRSMLDNFQKLRYWGLAEQSYDMEGRRMDGQWHVTALGASFCQGEAAVYRRVWTYLGSFLEFDEGGGRVCIHELHPGYLDRSHYSDAARPH